MIEEKYASALIRSSKNSSAGVNMTRIIVWVLVIILFVITGFVFLF